MRTACQMESAPHRRINEKAALFFLNSDDSLYESPSSEAGRQRRSYSSTAICLAIDEGTVAADQDGRSSQPTEEPRRCSQAGDGREERGSKGKDPQDS